MWQKGQGGAVVSPPWAACWPRLDCPAVGRVAGAGGPGGPARLSADPSPHSAAMSYPVTTQPQCASTCYQTQLSDWHTGLTDCCNDMPVCECREGEREGGRRTPPARRPQWRPRTSAVAPTLLGPRPHLPTLDFPLVTPAPSSNAKPPLLGPQSPLGPLRFLRPRLPPGPRSPAAGGAGARRPRPSSVLPAPPRSVRHFRSPVPRLPHLRRLRRVLLHALPARRPALPAHRHARALPHPGARRPATAGTARGGPASRDARSS